MNYFDIFGQFPHTEILIAMLTENDHSQIRQKGIHSSIIEKQIKNYINGFPFIELVAAATPGHGILMLEQHEVERLAASYHRAVRGREILKFVPASGAASRMFKNLFEFREELEKQKDVSVLQEDQSFNSPFNFFSNLKSFAFFEDLDNIIKHKGFILSKLIDSKEYATVLNFFLEENGLNYANLPKGLLKFHRYRNEESRTAMEEHLVEAAHYACDNNDVARVHFTVSPEHRQGFINLANKVVNKYERRFNVRFEISYSVQKPETDMIAVDLNNEPFRERDGSLLFRPGGHGALIENMNDLHGDIVFVKNIDNVVPDRLKATTYLYKHVIGAMLCELQTEIFSMLTSLDNPDIKEERLAEMAIWANEKLNIRLPADFREFTRKDKIAALKRRLDRPIRICGMVKNEGEPGGGPFWVKDADGALSLQIVESSQINPEDPKQKQIMLSSTHFNPVDLVCGLKNYKGETFHLPDYVDPNTGFISEKSKDGRKLKAQELPGLWNGAMSDWISIFVEVPVITFNPVKVINDLLRKEHLLG